MYIYHQFDMSMAYETQVILIGTFLVCVELKAPAAVIRDLVWNTDQFRTDDTIINISHLFSVHEIWTSLLLLIVTFLIYPYCIDMFDMSMHLHFVHR